MWRKKKLICTLIFHVHLDHSQPRLLYLLEPRFLLVLMLLKHPQLDLHFPTAKIRISLALKSTIHDS